MKMEVKKQFLRGMSIALMLSVIVPAHAAESSKLTKIQLYKKCIIRKCNAAEKAQVRADLKKAAPWAAGALLLAAAAAIGVKYWPKSTGKTTEVEWPADKPKALREQAQNKKVEVAKRRHKITQNEMENLPERAKAIVDEMLYAYVELTMPDTVGEASERASEHIVGQEPLVLEDKWVNFLTALQLDGPVTPEGKAYVKRQLNLK